ncbi:unnamed protein product [Gongylonema pulchrum]|uniref:Uncharacterized protein n=1 Tax=Gongylonema pulchrum TaxID=637853 RepID=A0A183EFR6_9BILA|nr:unnamed protein product [Gongylonema pulchrum]
MEEQPKSPRTVRCRKHTVIPPMSSKLVICTISENQCPDRKPTRERTNNSASNRDAEQYGTTYSIEVNESGTTSL